MAEEKKITKGQYETIKTLRKYKRIKYGMKAGTYASCLIPFGVILGTHWSEWFAAQDESGISIGVGFGMLLVATISTIVCIMKRDEEFMKKFSPLLYVSVLCAMWAVSFMFLYTAIGIASGGVIDQVDSVFVDERYKILVKVAEDNGLTNKGAFIKQVMKQAKEDAERKQREAVE